MLEFDSGETHYQSVLTYIKRFDLYKPAIAIYKPSDPEKYKDVLKLYANNVEERGTFDEAALRESSYPLSIFFCFDQQLTLKIFATSLCDGWRSEIRDGDVSEGVDVARGFCYCTSAGS